MLLLNLGGPETLDDVQPFLYNLFADPDIIRLPKAAQFLQPLIATVISSLRAPKSAEGCVPALAATLLRFAGRNFLPKHRRWAVAGAGHELPLSAHS